VLQNVLILVPWDVGRPALATLDLLMLFMDGNIYLFLIINVL
jgi:hypothetical protein